MRPKLTLLHRRAGKKITQEALFDGGTKNSTWKPSDTNEKQGACNKVSGVRRWAEWSLRRNTFEVQAVQAALSVLEPGSVQCTPTQTPSGQAAQALPVLPCCTCTPSLGAQPAALKSTNRSMAPLTDKTCETSSRQGEAKGIVSSGATIYCRSQQNYECWWQVSR